jgi:uncharacterized protein (TIGR03083 family)
MAVNTMDYSAKPLMLDVIRTERSRFYNLIDDPKNWEVQTRCEEWQTRDIAGHMIDVTEGYLDRWKLAQEGKPVDTRGLLVMAEGLDDKAKTFRAYPREQVIARLKSDSDKMMSIFDGLTENDWNKFLVTHPYMGPLPTLFYPAFHVMDYGVHSWDIEWGLGAKNAPMNERAAGVLVPYMLGALLPSTVDQNSAKGVDAELGLIVDGEWGGRWRVKIKDGQFSSAPADNLDGVQATLHFKSASDFVLTCFQRFPGGEATGDPKVIEQYRNLFFKI